MCLGESRLVVIEPAPNYVLHCAGAERCAQQPAHLCADPIPAQGTDRQTDKNYFPFYYYYYYYYYY